MLCRLLPSAPSQPRCEPGTSEKNLLSIFALRFHSDKNNGCTRAAENFKKILAAYEVLIDPDLRSQYDMARVSHTSGRCYIISCGQDPEEASIWAEEASRDDCDCASCAKVKEEKLKKQREDELREQERLEREWAQKERLRMEQREKERKEARTRSRQPYKERVDPRNYTEEEAAAFQNAGTSQDTTEHSSYARSTPYSFNPENGPEPTGKADHKFEDIPQPPPGQPTYSTYWINHTTMTPYYESIRNNFDRARELYHQTGGHARLVDFEEKKRAWAEARRAANQLRQKAKEEEKRLRKADRERMKASQAKRGGGY